MASQPGRLRARIVPRARLSTTDRTALWNLYARYYDGVSPAAFEQDLAAKHHVILLRDTQGTIRGFSTLRTDEETIDGRRVIVVYSGDTILERTAWGGGALQNAFGRYITQARLRHPLTPVYWFLISKGYRTYLLLARNFPEHWPRHDAPTPSAAARLIAALAERRFGAAWQGESGVLRHGDDQPRLRAGIAPVDETALNRPEVRFFLHANPGHADGDELACIGRITMGVWVRYLGKRARRAVARPEGRPRPWGAPSQP